MPTLASISDIRLRRDIAVDDESVYNAYLETVENMFENMTKRLWKYREGVEQNLFLESQNQVNATRLYTKIFPIIKIAASGIPQVTVKQWSISQAESEATTLDYLDDYHVIADRGIITRRMPNNWRNNVKIVVSGGYKGTNATTAVTAGFATPPATPPDIVEAIVRQAVFMRLRTEGDRLVLQSQSSLQGTANVSYAYLDKPIDPLFAAIVSVYTRRAYGGYG